MSEIVPGTADNLPAWLGFLHVPDCRCSWEWKALGTLHLVSLGKGWVRMTTAADCPHHTNPWGRAADTGREDG